MHRGIGVVDTPHGRGLRATEPIKAGEVLLYAPAAAQLDGVDADALATTLLAELERGTHEWLAALPRGVATLSEAELGNTLAEPHPSWMVAIEAGWRQRYGSGS